MSSKKHKQQTRSRDAPVQKRNGVMLCAPDAWQVLCGTGYRPLTSCPEVMMCVNVYADLISSMTLHLMANTPTGDIRIKNELSRRLDISPNRLMTRSTLIHTIVETLILEGNQITVPVYRAGYLEELVPVPPSKVAFVEANGSYMVRINGREVSPDTVLHFVWRPDPEQPWRGRGVTGSLRDVVKSLRQADDTRQSLLASPMPSLIVKVDGYVEELQTAEGRDKLRRQYVDASDNGVPWMVPADAMTVEKVQPLTLADLAIKDSLELDKRAAAALLGVPAFMVGVGNYNADEYNNFVSTRVMALAKVIEQVLTKGTLYSPDLYWRFNNRSLLSYALSDIINAGREMVDRQAMRRNEWRDWLNMPPDADMEELIALENYIPASMLGQQKKLIGGETDGKTDESGAE